MNNSIGQFSDQAFLAGFYNRVNTILGPPELSKQAGFTKQALGFLGSRLIGAAAGVLPKGKPLLSAIQLAMKNNPAAVTGLAAMKNVTPTVSQPLRTAAQLAMQRTNPQAIVAANQALSRTAPMLARTGNLVRPSGARALSSRELTQLQALAPQGPGQLAPHVFRNLPGRQAIPILRGPATPGAYAVNMGAPARTLRLTNRATPRTSINIAGRQPVTAPAGAGIPPGGAPGAVAAASGGLGPTGQVLGGVGAQPGLMSALAPLGAGMGVGAYWDPFDEPDYESPMAAIPQPALMA